MEGQSFDLSTFGPRSRPGYGCNIHAKPLNEDRPAFVGTAAEEPKETPKGRTRARHVGNGSAPLSMRRQCVQSCQCHPRHTDTARSHLSSSFPLLCWGMWGMQRDLPRPRNVKYGCLYKTAGTVGKGCASIRNLQSPSTARFWNMEARANPEGTSYGLRRMEASKHWREPKSSQNPAQPR